MTGTENRGAFATAKDWKVFRLRAWYYYSIVEAEYEKYESSQQPLTFFIKLRAIITLGLC